MSKKLSRINHHPILGPLEPRDPFEIFLDGQPVEALKGDSVASALLASGISVLRHTSSRKSNRGLFCGVGRCGDCFMQIDGLPGQPACTTPARPDQALIISSELPSAPFRLSRVSNYPGPDHFSLPGQAGLVVVGAGMAGAGVALAIGQSGGKVCLVEERIEPFFNRKADLTALPSPPPQLAEAFPELNRPGLFPFQVAAILQNSLASSPGITLLTRTSAAGLFYNRGEKQLILTTETFSKKVVVDRIVVATGSYSQPLAFPGWTLPGVLLEQAALDLLHRYRVIPREPVLICGNLSYTLKLAQFFVMAGVKTAGVVGMELSRPEPLASPGSQENFGTKSTPQFQSFEGLYLGRAEGSKELERAVLYPVDPEGQPIILEVGTLVLTGKEAPLIELAAQAGARFTGEKGGEAPYLQISKNNETSLPGVYAAGKAANIFNQASGWQTFLAGWQLGRRLSVDLSEN